MPAIVRCALVLANAKSAPSKSLVTPGIPALLALTCEAAHSNEAGKAAGYEARSSRSLSAD
jgi:hypothetical protein